MTRLTTFAEVKSAYRIEDIAERLGISITTYGRGYLKCLCPFHDDHSASLGINIDEQYALCFQPGCAFHGDIFDLVQKYLDLDGPIAAKRWIENSGITTKAAPQRRVIRASKSKPDTRALQMALTNSLQYQAQAVDEWARRAIPAPAVSHYQIGALPHYRVYARYTMQDGTEIERLSQRRFTIPWRRGSAIYGIKLRLDVRDADEKLALVDSALIDKVRADLSTRYQMRQEDITQNMLRDVFFGDRYLSIAGSRLRNRIYNSTILAKVANGKVVYPHHDLLFVTEGEINVHTMTHVAGLPAVAVKHSRHMPQAFQNVSTLVVLQDNDGPGAAYAQNVVKQSGRTLGDDAIIIVPPTGYNDVNDLAQDGRLLEWLAAALAEHNITLPYQKVVMV